MLPQSKKTISLSPRIEPRLDDMRFITQDQQNVRKPSAKEKNTTISNDR